MYSLHNSTTFHSNTSFQVRVYTVSQNNGLIESVWNSTAEIWYDQDISKGPDRPAAGSHLTAYFFFRAVEIRVYYQGEDGYIREAAYVGAKSWGRGSTPTIQDFPRAKSGTGLAVVSFPDTDESEAKLFYQSMEGKLTSYDYKPAATWRDSWKNCGFPRPTPENGYKISTKRFPSNSKRRPWIYTRRSAPYCHNR